jgi:hypothetical protein
MLSYLRKKFKRKTLKSNIQKYVAKQKDICCENDVDRKQAIEHLFSLYTEMSGDEYLSSLYTDFAKFIGYKEELQRKRDNQGLSLLTQLEKDTHVNGVIDKNAVSKALLEVPLYYLLSFLGYAYYRYKVDIIPESSNSKLTSPTKNPMQESDPMEPSQPLSRPMSYNKIPMNPTSASKFQTFKSPSKIPFRA